MTTRPQTINREAWLNRLAEMLRPWFREAGYPVHGRISIGMSIMKGYAGLCKPSFNKDKQMHHIFVTAYEDGEMADPVIVGETLVHELTHAILPVGTGHKKAFWDAAAKLGFYKTGKGSHTAPMPKLREHLEKLIAALPPLPRYGISHPPPRIGGGGGGGAFRFQCPTCKIAVTIKYTSLKKAGTPVCWNGDCEAMYQPMEDKTELK